MDVFLEIEAVYRRALLLRQYALEPSVQPDLLEKAIQELYFVLEELQTSQEELHQQNQLLIATRHVVELENQRYQALFELAPNGYIVTDRPGKIHQANHYAAAQLFCTSPEYLINKPLLVFIDESDRPSFRTQLTKLTPGPAWEGKLTPRNGRIIWVAIAVTRIKTVQGHEDMLLWSLNDITLRKQLEYQLQNAYYTLETRFEKNLVELDLTNLTLQQEFKKRQQTEQKISLQLTQSIDDRQQTEQQSEQQPEQQSEQSTPNPVAQGHPTADAIFVVNLDHRVLFWSKAAEQLYGWGAADILGNPASMLFPQSDSIQLAYAQLMAEFTLALERTAWQGQIDQITCSGKLITVESQWNLVRDEAGQPQSILVVNTAIPERMF